MVRLHDKAERIPLTVADMDPERGTITMVIPALGKSTREMRDGHGEGDSFLDLVGPPGQPQHVERVGHMVLDRAALSAGIPNRPDAPDNLFRIAIAFEEPAAEFFERHKSQCPHGSAEEHIFSASLERSGRLPGARRLRMPSRNLSCVRSRRPAGEAREPLRLKWSTAPAGPVLLRSGIASSLPREAYSIQPRCAAA
jgi:hypothetical protein